MRTIYAIQIQIAPNGQDTAADCLTDVIVRIAQWVERKYQNAWSTTVSVPVDGERIMPLPGHSLHGLTQSADNAELFALEWTHPADDDPSTAWVTNCLVGRDGDTVQFSLLLRISTTKEVLRPVRFDLGRPRLITDLLADYRSTIDGWPITTELTQITSPQVSSYVQDVLVTGTRNLPIVMVSPDVWNGRFAVDPSALLDRVKGFAHVTVLADKWAAFTLTDVVGKPLSCYDGAIRVYWPGFSLHDNPFHHKLYLQQSIRFHEDQGLPLPDHLFRMLSAVASFRYAEGETIRKARRAIADVERRRIDELRMRIQSGSVEKEKLELQLLEALERIDALEAERDQLKVDLSAQQAAWAEVQQAIAAAPSDAPEATSDQEVGFESICDVVRNAEREASDALVILDSALDSAKNSPFRNIERVSELFEAIAIVADEWREGGGALGQSWEQAFANLGFEYKDKISQTSRGKWRADYEFVYHGEKRLFEQHITIGSGQPDKCLSVHWWRDDEKRVLVIGHCGRHLTNMST